MALDSSMRTGGHHHACLAHHSVWWGPPSAHLHTRSTMHAEGRYRALKQQPWQPQLMPDKLLGQQRRDQDSKEELINYRPAATGSTASTPSAPPKSWRLPQPPTKRTVPEWVEDCFVKDEYALVSEEECGTPFLREGVVPEVGMKLYMQMTYEHDGSHPQHYRHWARMMGEVTHLYEPPKVGVCAVYEGQQVVLSDRELQQERSELPVLPPSLFGRNATCRCCRTADQVVQQYGAVHGQRVQGCMWLMNRDADLEPQLGGEWTVELVANDNLESMWVVCAMRRSDDSEQQQEQQQQESQHSEQARHSLEGVHVKQELQHDQQLELSPAQQQRLPQQTAQHQLQGVEQHAAHPLQPAQQRLPQQTAQHQLQQAEQHAAHPLQQVLPKAIDAQQARRQLQHAGGEGAQHTHQHSGAWADPAPTAVSAHSQPLRRSRDSDDQPAPQRFDMHRQHPERSRHSDDQPAPQRLDLHRQHPERSREREGQPRQRSNDSQPRRHSSESGGEPAAGGLDRDSQRDHSREREDQPRQRGWDGDRQLRRRSDDSGGHARDCDRYRQQPERSREGEVQIQQRSWDGDRQPRRSSGDSDGYARDWDRDRQHPESSREREREEQPRQRSWDGDRQPRRRSDGSDADARDWDRDRQHPEQRSREREREVQQRQRRPDGDCHQDDLQLEGPGDRRSLSDHEQQRQQRNSRDGCSRSYGQQRGWDHQQQHRADAHVQPQQPAQRGAKREREGAHGHDSKHGHYSDDRGRHGRDHSWEHDRESKRSHSNSSGRSSH